MSSQACTLSHSWMVRSSRLALSLVSLEKINSSWKDSRSSRLLFVNLVWFTRKIHMIRCSSRILFASSYFSKGIKSLLSPQRATPGSFIHQIPFRNLQLRERLQSLQPRERVVLIIMEYLILQDYLNQSEEESQSQASSRLQSLKSTWSIHSSKESWRSTNSLSIVIKEKKIRSFSYFRTLNFKNGIKEIFRDIQRRKSRKRSKRSSSHSAVQVMKFMIRFLSISYQVKNRRRSLSQGGSLDPGQVNSRRDLLEKDTLRSLTKSQSMLILRKPRHSRSYSSWVKFTMESVCVCQMWPQRFSIRR